ncbi:MAG: RusA family crossover junction endodeoxyribonuclease [Alcaligenaceae bacterium]|uniref:Endodeoxyribonuclease RusA n=1 Tax=Paracidovorax wautersii TaxID=1177982 RepID=A0A1I2F768_9BURK|nr:MAG: RusA family crossover junction endodeoxyribonuclease [Alcaligenaceae bacterium]SFF00667.1 Endodeoxyribonuclease RusA [Paracidovorax wautersii]
MRLEVVLHAKKTKKATGKRPRCIDLSNSLKVAEDSLIGIAFTDDAQTRSIAMAYGEPVPGGALVITVSSLKDVQ